MLNLMRFAPALQTGDERNQRMHRVLGQVHSEARCGVNFGGGSDTCHGTTAQRPATSSQWRPVWLWEGSNILTLSEQQYLVWHTVSQSTKRQDMLEISGGGGGTLASLATPMVESAFLHDLFWFKPEYEKIVNSFYVGLAS